MANFSHKSSSKLRDALRFVQKWSILESLDRRISITLTIILSENNNENMVKNICSQCDRTQFYVIELNSVGVIYVWLTYFVIIIAGKCLVHFS